MKQQSFWDTDLGFALGAVLLLGVIPFAVVVCGVIVFSLPDTPRNVILIVVGALVSLVLLIIFPGSFIEEARYRRRKEKQRRQAQRESWAFQEGLRQQRMGRNGGHDIEIVGSELLRQRTVELLDALKVRCPSRYAEAVAALPWVQEVDTLGGAAANSGGKFIKDVATWGPNHFRNIYLHEVGHQVSGHGRNDWSEEAARRYSSTVQAELGADVQL